MWMFVGNLTHRLWVLLLQWEASDLPVVILKRRENKNDMPVVGLSR